MPMSPRLRRLTLVAHVACSVGWLGAVAAYLVLALVGLRGDAGAAVYPAMGVLGWYVIVPGSLAALLTGLVQSLGTAWGLFRYRWVVTKLLLTIGATTFLIIRAQAFFGAAFHVEGAPPAVGNGFLRAQLVVHAVGGLLVLLAATTLSVYKPWGRTAYGQRKQGEGRGAPQLAPSPVTSRRGLYVLLAVVGLLLLLAGLHLAAGRIGAH
jgi:hypothetical protein